MHHPLVDLAKGFGAVVSTPPLGPRSTRCRLLRKSRPRVGPPLRRFAANDVGESFAGSAKLRGGVGGGSNAIIRRQEAPEPLPPTPPHSPAFGRSTGRGARLAPRRSSRLAYKRQDLRPRLLHVVAARLCQ